MWNLTIERVNEIFKAKNASGSIANGKNYSGGKASTFAVVFYNGGKVYTYKARTLLALCEKLELVPENDICAEAETVEYAIRNNNDAIAQRAALDTARHLLDDIRPAGHVLDTEDAGMDEWNNTMARFYWKKSAWVG